MGKIIYTKEEKQAIAKSLSTIIDDLRDLWKTSKSRSIEVDIPNSTLSLKVSNSGILLKEYHFGRLLLPSYTRRWIELNTTLGRIKGTLPYQLSMELLKNYESIREEIEYSINKDIKSKESQLDTIKSLSNKYGKSVDIELEVPPTQNAYSLDIKKENGKNIGTINLGQKTVRIITEGEILVTDKQQEQDKIKKKAGNCYGK